jgi:hypothetical protein
MRIARALALAVAACALGLLLYMIARRAAWPYDLEWMEGGMLCHSLRLVEGKPIYAPPSVDFVPFLYTPLYPAVVAWLARLGPGVGYGLARAVSLVGFFGALLLGYVFARREGGSRACALAAMALPAAAWAPTGAWYDLARPDSLWLGLTTAAVCVAWWKRATHLGAASSAALLVLAFYTKQTASPFMIAIGVALLATHWRAALTYAATLALLGLPSLYWFNHSTHGWFWTYVFRVHQAHAFYPMRAFVGTPLRLLAIVGPAALLVPWALLRRSSPGLRYASFIGLVGAAAACLGFATQWAFLNAFIPGVFFPSLAVGVAAGRLVVEQSSIRFQKATTPRHRPTAVYLVLAASLALAPGALYSWIARVAPASWGFDPSLAAGYDPRPFVPTRDDRARGAQVVERLRAVDGDILVPFHPFYAHLAGKPTHVHGMGVLDVSRAGLGLPGGFAEALRDRRFAAVAMDKLDGNWSQWPAWLAHYRASEPLVGARTFSGAPTQPRFLFTPPPVVDREP